MNGYEPYGGFEPYGMSGAAEPLGKYTAKTFGWMFLGLLTTFAVSILLYGTGYVWFLFQSSAIIYGLAIAELAVVLILSARIGKLSVAASRTLFFLYAVLNGIVFSAYFLLFELPGLILVFAITAVYFGVMAAVGYFTSFDLSRLRNILLGGLVALLAFWLLSIFFDLSAFERLACFIGVAIFLAFTAYDTQKIRACHAAYAHDSQMLAKASIFSALQLYLDFINLFLYILRIFGKRK